ncbi:hypothetical protein CsSME_00024958 [Camellia sinensis var. sinensis]
MQQSQNYGLSPPGYNSPTTCRMVQANFAQDVSSGLRLELWLLRGNKELLLTHNNPGVDTSFNN